MSGGKHYLFLQGPASPFFRHLAKRLRQRGHQVTKLVFNGGDWLYWASKDSVKVNCHLADLPEWYRNFFQNRGVTDLVLFGDSRPVHRAAIAEAEQTSLTVHVFEEGYFRPHWVTLERGGVNHHSLLPRDSKWYLAARHALPDGPRREVFRTPFWVRASHDVLYHLGGIVNPVLFRAYRSHALYEAPQEYVHYLMRFARLKWRRYADQRKIDWLRSHHQSYFLLPLQLDGDAQIRSHSEYDGMAGVLGHVMASFARSAKPPYKLVIKNHPLDPGVASHERTAWNLAKQFGIEERLIFLESGPLESLIAQSAGVVTVNSTVGLVSLESGCPTLALGRAIYNLRGLTFEEGLDRFWQNPTKPRKENIDAFCAVVRHVTQINGGFYCRPSIKIAVENAIEPLESHQCKLVELRQRVERP